MASPDDTVPLEALLRHREWVRGVARALVRADQDADDLEQEAWLAAAKGPPPDGRAPRAWLGTVLRRTAAKLRLRDARRQRREHAVAPPEQRSEADLVAEAEMHERVVRTVLALPEPYRATVLWRYFENLTPAEIADRTSTPVGTVRARLSRALALLRPELKDRSASAWPLTLVALAHFEANAAVGVAAGGVALMTQAKAVAVTGLAILVAAGLAVWLLIRVRDEPASSGEVPILPAASSPSPDARAQTSRLPEATTAEVPPILPRPFDPPGDPGSHDPPSLTINAIWEEDGTPAEGITVWLIEFGTQTGVWKERWLVSGPGGVVRAGRVTRGRVVAYGDRGGSVSTTIGEDKPEPLTLEIPRGCNVDGRVVTREGAPIAGADVWMSTYGNLRSGAVVTRSDADGAFRLRSVNSFCSFAARAPGHSQSEAHQIQGKVGETVKVELRLGPPAGSVRGVVLGPDGEPAGGAAVQMLSPPIAAASDAKGVFVISSLPPGEDLIEARVPGFAPWRGSAVIRAGEESGVEIRLRKEAVVTGTVKLTSGAPAADVSVSVGVPGHFLSSTTNSAADGSYRLGSLPSGQVEVTARRSETGNPTAKLECVEGGEIRWDPVIDPGLTITGFVRDESDKPIAGWIVSARWNDHRDRVARPTGGTTDERGRFSIINCPDAGPYRLEARPKKLTDPARAFLEGVRPGDGEPVIRVTTKNVAMVKGRVVSHDGSPAAAEVVLRTEPDAGIRRVNTDPKTGAFSAPWLPPGRWRITVPKDPVGDVEVGELDLEAGATVDVGEIKLPARGTLIIDLSGAEDLAPEVVYSIWPNERHSGTVPTWIPGPFKIAHKDLPNPFLFPAGSYRLEVSGARIERKDVGAFVIEPGKETRVAVTARAGVACELRFSVPEGEARDYVSYAITPDGGRTAVSGMASWNGKDKTLRGTCVLQAGQYRLFARSGTGLEATRGLDVPQSREIVHFDVSLASPWPVDGLPVTFRFIPSQGQERRRVQFFVLDVDARKQVGDGGTTVTAAGTIEARVRLKPGNYALILPPPLQLKRQPFVVKEGDAAQVFEFSLDPP